MEMDRAIKVQIDIYGVIACATGPNSVAFVIVVPPVTAVMIVQTANMYPRRLWRTGYLFRNDALNWNGPMATNNRAAAACICKSYANTR